MKFSALWISLAILVTPTVVFAKTAPTFPKAIQGIWISDDEEGQTQCRRYLEASRQDGVDSSDYLVGAIIIRSTMWHIYLEYGEGASYEILSLEKLDGRRWRFSARGYENGEPQAFRYQPMVSRVRLDDRKLIWNLESYGGLPVDSWDEHRYFRCAPVPHSLFAS